MLLFKRQLQLRIEQSLFGGRIIVIYGARQVGKTTLCKSILESIPDGRYLTADERSVRDNLTNRDAAELKRYIGNSRLVIIDEAQRVENIGLTLKLLVDTYPDIQIIAAGSSSFELANKISEPLTGRADIFHLQPLSLAEIVSTDTTIYQQTIERTLILGSYPGIWAMPDDEAARSLTELSSNYLFRDLLEFENLKKAPLLTQLLQALALQLGNEVSFSELANLLRVDVKTIERYLFLLEQSFVVYRLPALKRNPRTEVGKLRKVYFTDLGLRNALIRNFNPLNLRTDVGALWENFCINERRKRNDIDRRLPYYYFWRGYQQQEVDFVEDFAGQISAYEFKWKPKGARLPKVFKELYPASTFLEVSPRNIHEFLTSEEGIV